MTHINPEIVADRLIELGVSQDEFITALATPSKNKELAKLANEVLEKIRGQRNPNSYGAKFIAELREHLKHHKDSCGSPALEEPVKKFVHNPSDLESVPGRISMLLNKAIASNSWKMFVSASNELLTYTILNRGEISEDTRYKITLFLQARNTHDRFDLALAKDVADGLLYSKNPIEVEDEIQHR